MILCREYKAPAKINLCLHVLGRREDGYHELAMAMQRVSLYDRLTIRIDPSGSGLVECSGLSLLPGEENLASSAARLLLDEVQSCADVTISLSKGIPVAAGLGGGSSDAATVLMAVNEMLELELDEARLRYLAARLGSDVPFFVFARPAWATGTGVCLEPLPKLPSVAFVLANPGIAVSTAEIYRSLRLTKGGELANLPRFSAMTKKALCGALHNDLEDVVLSRYPVVAEVKRALCEQGACGALMSGSGATVFGVFDDFRAARRAAEALQEKTGWFVRPVRPLP